MKRLVAFYALQNTPVAAAPAIDALLYVAHDEAALPVRTQFANERTNALPLRAARVLKLVNHGVLIARASLFKHKRRVAVFHHFAQQELRYGEEHQTKLCAYLVHLFGNDTQQAKRTQPLQRKLTAII